jgi:hypothetical protein
MFALMLFFTVSGIDVKYIPSTKIPPSNRLYHFMDYYQAGNFLITFGGSDGTMALNDLWTYSFTNNNWNELIPTVPKFPCII